MRTRRESYHHNHHWDKDAASIGTDHRHQSSNGGGPHHHLGSLYTVKETRFPHASYAMSKAAKSDIATICSGSVFEDIDVARVMSGDTSIITNIHKMGSGTAASGSISRNNSVGGVNMNNNQTIATR